MKPNSYKDWKHCITVLCNIPLTLDYIEKRLAELNDFSNHRTKKFIQTWGKPHLQQVIAWFKQAKEEIQS